VIGDDHRLSRFVPVAVADDFAARIGRPPCGRGILGELIREPVPLRLEDLTRPPNSFGSRSGAVRGSTPTTRPS